MRQVLVAGALLLLSAQVAFGYGDCGDAEHYRSTDGSCVHVPYAKDVKVPNETATCRDGTHSVSHHHQGTCSHHGGVDHWG